MPTAYDLVFHFQTRLQGVANGLSDDLRAILSRADERTIKILKSDWGAFTSANPDVKTILERANRIVKEIQADRATAFDDARKLTFERSEEVANAAQYTTIEEIKEAYKRGRKAEKARRKKEIKPLNKKELNAVLNYSPIEGETVAGWFQRWQNNDLERIAQAVRQGAAESLSIYEIVRKIRGTKENGYKDGVVQTTQSSASTVARTLINGVSNVARFETMRQNADALDGVQFLATLDARTSFICASLDGKIWKGDEIRNAARPPLHPNCRSTLIPYIELVDADGKPIEDDLTRAAANADFDKLAKDAYNADAKARGLSRRWDDLAPSTRKKYYYQAQRDWEARNGRNAYRQVPAKTNFREYFENQPDDFKRAWLGEGRYLLYKNGQATLDDLIKPASTFRSNVDDVFAPSISAKRTAPLQTPTNGTPQAGTTTKDASATSATSQGSQQNAPTPASDSSTAPTYKTPIESAADAVQRIDETRVKTVGLEQAVKTVNEINADNAIINSYQDALAELNISAENLKKAEAALDSAERIYRLTGGSHSAEKDYREAYKKYSDAFEKRKKTKDEYIKAHTAFNARDKKREKDRAENARVVDVLFPDNGGKPFFDDSFVEKIRDLFENQKKGLGSIATDVFDMYNRIGRSINTDGKTYRPISNVVFSPAADMGRNRGDFNPSLFRLRLLDTLINDPDQLRSTFAHEIGHWVENSVPRQRATDNANWLMKETGGRKIPLSAKKAPEKKEIPLIPGQRLCGRADGYLQTVYTNFHYRGETFHNTELVSTAMECFLDDAEAFVRRNPKHFDLLMDNLKELVKK